MNNPEIPPWHLPGYKGKLRKTFGIEASKRPVPIDDLIEATLELMLEGVLTQERATEILNRYDNLKKQGQHYL